MKNRLCHAASTAAAGAGPERIFGFIEFGQADGSFYHDRRDQLSQHRCLPGAGRAVHREQSRLLLKRAEDGVDRELLAERQRLAGVRWPATGGSTVRGDMMVDEVWARAEVDAISLARRTVQVCGESGAAAVCVSHLGQVCGEEAVQEIRAIHGEFALAADEDALDPETLGAEGSLDIEFLDDEVD